MIAPGGHQKRLLWLRIVIASVALLGISVACEGRTAGAIPQPAALTAAATPAITPRPLGLLKVSPEEGPVGSAFTVTGDGLPPGKPVDLVWVAADNSDVTHVKERFSIGRSVTNASGVFTASLTALEDHGEFFAIYAIVDGENLAQGSFRVPRAV
ncbi:MAG: hypothetical protein HYY31_01740 [Chloroflexi bacterium]|nr:hypothetical protein [Chloroflexota bacterium]